MYDIGFIAASVSSGGIAGFLIGYAVKKGIKIIMTIAGLFLAGLAYLNYQGLIKVDWNQVVSISSNAVSEFSTSAGGYASAVDTQVIPTLMNFGVPLTGSFATGFVLGCLKG
ncbi:MAG: FUN14 domain-containing protein [Thermoproteota archaeon]